MSSANVIPTASIVATTTVGKTVHRSNTIATAVCTGTIGHTEARRTPSSIPSYKYEKQQQGQ
jgi:hypothetical protein